MLGGLLGCVVRVVGGSGWTFRDTDWINGGEGMMVMMGRCGCGVVGVRGRRVMFGVCTQEGWCCWALPVTLFMSLGDNESHKIDGWTDWSGKKSKNGQCPWQQFGERACVWTALKNPGKHISAKLSGVCYLSGMGPWVVREGRCDCSYIHQRGDWLGDMLGCDVRRVEWWFRLMYGVVGCGLTSFFYRGYADW